MDLITFVLFESFSLIFIILAFKYKAVVFDVINIVFQLFFASFLFSAPLITFVTVYNSTSSTYTPYNAYISFNAHMLIFIPIMLLIISAIHMVLNVRG